MHNHDHDRDSVSSTKPEDGSLPATELDSHADSRPATEPESSTRIDSSDRPAADVKTQPDSQLTTWRESDVRIGSVGVPATGLEKEEDPLVEFLERWEDHCQQGEAATLESMGIDDPSLVQALRDRIEQQKRLYAFLGLSSLSEPGDDSLDSQTAGANPQVNPDPVVAPVRDRDPTHPPLRPDPSSIGRYRVIRILGQGGFGRVYLAHDPDLDRYVAIKVPIHLQASQFVDFEAYLKEACILARLSHPNIVPVHDVGRTDDGRCYVVSKYMDGGDLAGMLHRGRPAFAESANLVAVLGDALHYTHTHDLFHRDIKPANILLDGAGVPYLADFGLALKDENLGKGARYVGTASYMSPEQARGEGHRVDGRSDIFSMGIVFYELLTGRRPFRGSSHQEVMEQIVNAEPRPPRQIDDTIPGELERICLKALAKRASERYSTARDLAEDLRHLLKTASWAAPTEDLSRVLLAVPTGTAPEPIAGPSDSSGRPIRIVPKGLGSFDENDADFFLELVPGPRDRDGIPDGLRYWKTRIEVTDPDKTFRVGLIYGPSGCGKSSLVKAGLLPRLALPVASIYIEATAGQTEVRLLRAIRKLFPDLPADGGLVGSLMILRRGPGLPKGHKVLLVLDQFEQWLFARREEKGTELVAALRQCDGEHIQALCLLRDDFWMAATRFMRDLEIDLVPDRNVAAVDLFDGKHARKVLSAYGCAFEALPARTTDLTKEQHAFLDQVIAGLTQDGHVVPVRLALFAEMVKGKPWTPATLRALGGMDGVGVRFLEETFSSARSNPNHRYHQRAAQAVLNALLPESDADIKGRMRSIEELRDVSGYTDRPGDFVDLIRTLDTDLHLITPVDPESSGDLDPPAHPLGGHYYQLTHDYLVHALRDWLTRKQRETRRGRAELLLAERSALWHAKPEDRHLPSVGEWATIRLLTQPKDWTDSQRQMIRRADRVIGLRGVGGALLLAGILAAGLAIHQRGIAANEKTHAEDLVQGLLKAETARVPEFVEELRAYRRWTDPELRRIVQKEKDASKQKLHASLALLPVDRDQVNYLLPRLLTAAPGEVNVLRQSLSPYRFALTPRLWNQLEQGDSPSLLQAAAALALYDPDHQRWAKVAGNVARAMVSVNPLHVGDWIEILRPVKDELKNPLKEIFRDEARLETDRVHAARLETDRVHAAICLVAYVPDRPEELVDLLKDADPKQFGILLPAVNECRNRSIPLLEASIREGEAPRIRDEDEKDRRAERRAKAAVALVCLGVDEGVWPLLVHSPDPRLRSFIIHWLAGLGADPATREDCLRSLDRAAVAPPAVGGQVVGPGWDDPNRSILFDKYTSIRRALILALGHFDPDRMSAEDRERRIRELLVLYRDDIDAGVHGASAWTLRRWHQEEQVNRIDTELARVRQWGNRRWEVNTLGQTMVIVDGPLRFAMGSPETEPDHDKIEESLHGRRIPRRFAIGAKEVSVGEFAEFLKENRATLPDADILAGTQTDLPQHGVSWYTGAAYCNWLSRREGRPEVYETNEEKQFAAGMRVKAGSFDQGGYRLPTEAEWEYACRAGAETSRCYGNSWRLLRKYARLVDWDEGTPLPCGSLLPNDLGLFDMLGNRGEWCHDRGYSYEMLTKQPASDFLAEDSIKSEARVMRGGCYNHRPPAARSAGRYTCPPDAPFLFNGFRLARTCP
jgi:serine/threonine protein kinase/formylglycine-generating enzyme required for sulfatase activity